MNLSDIQAKSQRFVVQGLVKRLKHLYKQRSHSQISVALKDFQSIQALNPHSQE